MTHAPTVVGLIPFVPSGSDFDKALAFFAEFGFATEWRDGPIAGLKFGAARILLQDIDIPDWQKNQMLTLEVDDLDGFWQHLRESRSRTALCGRSREASARLPVGSRSARHRSGRRLLARAPGADLIVNL